MRLTLKQLYAKFLPSPPARDEAFARVESPALNVPPRVEPAYMNVTYVFTFDARRP